MGRPLRARTAAHLDGFPPGLTRVFGDGLQAERSSVLTPLCDEAERLRRSHRRFNNRAHHRSVDWVAWAV